MSRRAIVAHMVMRNESARYLANCLYWLWPQVDHIHIFDDRSTDDSVDVAQQMGATVTVRDRAVPTMLVDEGAFRQEAWRCFTQLYEPDESTWVVLPDADEFLVAHDPLQDERELLEANIAAAEAEGAEGITFAIPEMFGWDEPACRPLVRTDGLWGTIRGCRLVRWRPGGKFPPGMASGSAPHYVRTRRRAEGMSLAHFGYVREADRRAKYARYTAVVRSGHLSRHVESIMAPPVLVPWAGKVPLGRL